jgi:hypothetical protein
LPPFQLSYILEKGRILGKGYEIKVRCYGNTHDEHIRNPLGTGWEHDNRKLPSLLVVHSVISLVACIFFS